VQLVTDDAPLVSVVIPCYNQAHFLGEAIESVLAQTYKNFEIVVVDDGSTDNTSEVASRYDGVRLIRQENRGLAEARNTGIGHSEGEYLVFLDADDRLLPEALQAGLECFASHPECAFVFGHFRYIREDGSLLREPTPPHDQGDHYIQLLSGPYIGVPAIGIYRRFIFTTVGLFDSSLNATADYDLYFRITKDFPAHRHNVLVAEYRQHGENMTGNAGTMLGGAIDALRKQKGYAKKDKRYWEAYKTGIRAWQSWYGIPLAGQVRRWVKEGERREALRGAWTLLRYYPGGLPLVVNRRYWSARELEVRDRKLRGRARRIRELTAALKKERAKVRELEERSRRSELRARSLKQELQEIQDSETWKLLQKLSHLRAKVRKL
jgi:glycosyltransferase involved in cell wall biosynthesis